MKPKESRQEAQKKIEKFFSELKDQSPEKIRKIKRLAMHYHISLHNYKKRYCKKCYSVFNSENSEIRIKNKIKTIRCKKCGERNRYKLTIEGKKK